MNEQEPVSEASNQLRMLSETAAYLVAQPKVNQGLVLERGSANVSDHQTGQQIRFDVEGQQALVLLEHVHNVLCVRESESS